MTFFYYQYGFRYSQSTADLLIVVSDSISGTFDRFGALELYVALDISKAFDRVWHAGDLQNINSYGISCLSFLSNRRIQMVLDGKSSREYPVNIRKYIFACLFSIHNTISSSCHEQVCLATFHEILLPSSVR